MEQKEHKYFVGSINVIVTEKGEGCYVRIEAPDFQNKGKKVVTKFGFKSHSDFNFFTTQLRQISDRIGKKTFAGPYRNPGETGAMIAHLVILLNTHDWDKVDEIQLGGIRHLKFKSNNGYGLDIRFGEFSDVFKLEDENE